MDTSAGWRHKSLIGPVSRPDKLAPSGILTLRGLRKMGVNLVHNGVGAFYRVADIDANDSFTRKPLFELDADIFSQNHHIGARHILCRQFIFQPNRA